MSLQPPLLTHPPTLPPISLPGLPSYLGPGGRLLRLWTQQAGQVSACLPQGLGRCLNHTLAAGDGWQHAYLDFLHHPCIHAALAALMPQLQELQQHMGWH
jgi:hypothetical protein